ncbi:MAG: AbrB/MazE/SpoVT family DNA-binding domain-containing protein [Patescibacteria group bacterium]
MKALIIKIGNSRGIRIPKKFLEETNLDEVADIAIEKGALVIRPVKKKALDEGVLLSRSALAKEWDSPEEDAAWVKYQ